MARRWIDFSTFHEWSTCDDRRRPPAVQLLHGIPPTERNSELKPKRVPARSVLDQRIVLVLESKTAVRAKLKANFRAYGEITPAKSIRKNGSILMIIGGLLIQVAVHSERYASRYFSHRDIFAHELVSAVIARGRVLGVDHVLDFR